MQCPKCRGSMRTFERNGIHIEQCDSCRGIFLDYGELETITRMEAQWSQQQHMAPPPAHGAPAWGAPHHGGHGGHRGHRQQRGWVGMLFSS